MANGKVNSAAARLEGLSLSNGWKVVKHLRRNEHATGGVFSESYIVSKGDRQGFLKAFDFSEAFESGRDTLKVLQAWTSAYNHEREILEVCKDKRLSKVVIALDHGEVQLPDTPGPSGRVFYLIFELADGDVRGQVALASRLDTVWCMHALRDASLGLWQVHRELIAHQDVKPSNVLRYDKEGFRIADFGRSSRVGHSVWYDDEPVAGDREYAPPELLYGFKHPEFAVRRIGCDLYMLGNLATFMFGGVNVTAGIFARLDAQFHPGTWQGTYAQVLPYVQDAFTLLLEELDANIDPDVKAHIVPLVRELCNPDVSRRGHPRGLGSGNQYSLERYVGTLTNLAKRIEIEKRVSKAAG